MNLELSSPAFAPFESIPSRFTCEGDDLSVPLRWSGVPENAKSLALIVDDPDAPDPSAPTTVFTHWVLYNLSPRIDEMPEGASPDRLPFDGREGKNDFGRVGYGGPCPPIGRHRYFHKLYALDTGIANLKQPTKAELEAAIIGHVIESSELVGTYGKGD